jgi:hypothetical protein
MSDASLRHEPERRQREALEDIFEHSSLSTFDMFRAFPVFTPRYTLARFLAHYELFKQILEVPGAIVDIGVYRGASAFTWAKLCEIFCPTDVRKKVYGFDTFAGFPNLAPEDGAVNDVQDVRVGGYHAGATIEHDLLAARDAMNHDRHLAHLERLEFVKGDLACSVPRFVDEQGQGLRIALLNLDADLYEPTRVALDHFVPLMSPGGIIILDEYAVTTFPGESQAVDEYFVRRFGRRAAIQKFPWHSNPSGFIKVDW